MIDCVEYLQNEGVIVCDTYEDAQELLQHLMERGALWASGDVPTYEKNERILSSFYFPRYIVCSRTDADHIYLKHGNPSYEDDDQQINWRDARIGTTVVMKPPFVF